MSSKVKILARNNLSVSLFNAMSATIVNRGEILEYFDITPVGYDTEVDVKVLINGKEIHYVEELAKFIKQMDESFEEAVKEEAVKLLTRNQKLRDLVQEIETAEYKIRECIEAIKD